MDKLFGVLKCEPFIGGASASEFVSSAASFLAELNAIHAFREGNGRVQLSFVDALSIRAGHEFDLTKLRHRAFLSAMIRSFEGDTASLKRALR